MQEKHWPGTQKTHATTAAPLNIIVIIIITTMIGAGKA